MSPNPSPTLISFSLKKPFENGFTYIFNVNEGKRRVGTMFLVPL